MTDIQGFIDKFDSSDVSRLAFAWNGEHAADLEDANLHFRRAVVQQVLANPEGASVELLRVLVDAETAFAQEAWGINLWVHTLAEQMLIRGGVSVVNDFLTFWYRGMDAHCELSRITLPTNVAEQYEAFCVEQRDSAVSQADQTRYEEGARFFGTVAETSKAP
jgi:hypothetical protein